MNKSWTSIAAALAVGLSATIATAEDGVVGKTFRTLADNNNYTYDVRFYDCEDKVCAVAEAAYDSSGKKVKTDVIGTRTLWDMTDKGNGKYGGGKIFAADTKKTYRSKMALEGDVLKVSGCIAVICRSQDWKQVK